MVLRVEVNFGGLPVIVYLIEQRRDQPEQRGFEYSLRKIAPLLSSNCSEFMAVS
jgi:hypothetical protein